MNTRIGKKLLSLMLVGCLCASLLPGTVLAANAEETAEPDSYIGDISADDADAVDEPAENAETATVEEDYTAPVSYADVESGTCGENVTWTLEDGVLTISGEGEMEDYAYGGTPWYSQLESVTTVVIGNGVTSIGEYAFYGCSSIESITISTSVTSIGSSAFEDCTSLMSITIPNSMTSIGSYAFEDCTSLTSIT
ncbi:MAG: leucine-rich repeat domain-containing protein, partial [Oscillospiraceae bacterium]|nr:leucine-rich repeat domain-containing protein [Oscillospiraceae bacterium]